MGVAVGCVAVAVARVARAAEVVGAARARQRTRREGGNGMAPKGNGTASLPFQEPAIMAMGSAPPPPIAPSGSSCSAQLRD